jgi:hypothetical protein
VFGISNSVYAQTFPECGKIKATRSEVAMKRVLQTSVILLSAMVLLLGTVVFLNWDYICFKLFLSNRYLKTEILDSIYEEYVGIDAKGEYYKYFDNLSIAAVTKLIRDSGLDNYTYQYNPDQFESYTSNREEKAKESYFEELTPETVYMKLTNFTPASLEFFKLAADDISGYSNLVLDLRGNGGGDLDVIFEIADYFIEKGSAFVLEQRRHKTTAIKAKTPASLDYEKIVVLQDGNTASASEQLIIALEANIDGFVKVGTPTRGKYLGQTRIPLLRDFYVKATTLEWIAPDGTVPEPGGITPDYVYEDEDAVAFVLGRIL